MRKTLHNFHISSINHFTNAFTYQTHAQIVLFFLKYSSSLTAQRSNIYINFSKWHSKFLGVYCDGFGAVVSFVDSN